MNSLVGSVFVCLAEKNQKQKTIHHYVIDIYIYMYIYTHIPLGSMYDLYGKFIDI